MVVRPCRAALALEARWPERELNQRPTSFQAVGHERRRTCNRTCTWGGTPERSRDLLPHSVDPPYRNPSFGFLGTRWTLTHALAMSADGRVIVGEGHNLDGNLEAWILRDTAASVPEPSTLALASVGGLALAGCRWRRRRTQE